jgi:hypothetical protein
VTAPSPADVVLLPPTPCEHETDGLVISEEAFAEILDAAGLWHFPQFGGTPGQTLLGNPTSFFKWWFTNRDRGLPLFLSHNGYEPIGEVKKVDRTKIVFRVAFGDFDTGDESHATPDDVHREIIDAAFSAIKKGLSFSFVASGSMGRDGKDEGTPCGFHMAVFFREETLPRRDLERMESALWRGWKNELSMRTVNIKCANPVCLRRVPYSRYSHKKDPDSTDYKAESNYCVPVPYEWILSGRWDAIRRLSFQPRLLDPTREKVRYDPPNFDGNLPTIGETISANGWNAFGREIDALHPFPTELPRSFEGSAYDANLALIPSRLCLQVLPFGANPRHIVRLAWIHEVIANGLSGIPYSEQWLQDFCDRVAEEAKWEDRGNVGERRKQVRYAYHRPYALDRTTGAVRLHPFSCRNLREQGACLGPKCPMFRSEFPGEEVPT